MGNTIERLEKLEEENQKLKQDNEMLLDIVVQMRVTLNRLVSRYVTESSE
ncbi:MAG TPA: hypothetical protein IAC37_13870 [Candidatus Ventrimonas merdavium]|nr:hypothetical protein [Candidatus Ventrimonas merdavium]